MAVKNKSNTGLLIAGGLILLGATGIAVASSRKKSGGGSSGLIDYGSDMMGEYFSYDEFIRSQTALDYNVTSQYNPPASAIVWGKKLAQYVLDPVRRQLGGPVIINSWYRSQDLQNLLVALGFPAVQFSQHRFGGTVDAKYNYLGERRNDLLIRAVLLTGVPFDRMLIEHGTVERPLWIQLEFDGSKTKEQQRGIIIRIPSGTSGQQWSREYTQSIYL